jgi:hypothetical protein
MKLLPGLISGVLAERRSGTRNWAREDALHMIDATVGELGRLRCELAPVSTGRAAGAPRTACSCSAGRIP